MELKTKKGIITITEAQGNLLINLVILVIASMGFVAGIWLLNHPEDSFMSANFNWIFLLLNIAGVVINFCYLVKHLVTYKAFENDKEKEES